MADFHFINSDGPKVPKEVRTLIRKQAMKDVGLARKQRKGANQARMKLVQPSSTDASTAADVPIRPAVANAPSFTHTMALLPTPPNEDTSPENDESSELVRDMNPTSTGVTYPQWMDRTWSLGPSPSPLTASGYEAMRSLYTIDILDLAALTKFVVGLSTCTQLRYEPKKFESLMGHRQYSYLDYVPAYFDSSDCVRAAATCVAAKVHSLLSPHSDARFQARVLRLYCEALRTLQTAIADEKRSTESDVLCAISLLGIHEILDFNQQKSWSYHIEGSERLIRHRSPNRFTTDFDKALFIAAIGPATSQALINNANCWIAEPQWMHLYYSISEESPSLTERSSIAINVRAEVMKVPGLWHDVQAAVTDYDSLFDDSVMLLLLQRCKVQHSAFLNWMDEYKDYCVRTSLSVPTTADVELRRELFGITLETMLIVKRLIATIYTVLGKCQEALDIEAETQAMARLALDLQNQPLPKYSWLFTVHEIGTAQKTILTKAAWEVDESWLEARERKLSARQRYLDYNHHMRGPKGDFLDDYPAMPET